MMNLHQLDLNLLVLFDALFQHRSVSIAAQKLCLSQSAFSHGIARLRERLNDPLFVRVNNTMEPTPRAVELADYLSSAFPLLERGLNTPSDFDPLTSEMTFKLIATDYTEFCLLPKLLQHFEKIAPNVTLKVLPANHISPNEHLENNDINFVLGFNHHTFKSSTIEHFTWLNEGYCTISRKSHPALNGSLTLENFLTLSHLLIAPWGEKQGIVDLTLAKNKMSRKIAIQLPSLLVAPHIIEKTDHLLTLPKLAAKQISQYVAIDIYEPPIDIPFYQLNVYWHKINANKASQKWFIEQVKQLF